MEALPVLGKEICEESLYFPLDFAINQKLLLKMSIEKTTECWPDNISVRVWPVFYIQNFR